MRMFPVMFSPTAEIGTSAPASLVVYVGTYTGKRSRGIYRFLLDPNSGHASDPTLAVETTNPSFLAADPQGRYVYACSEIGDFQGRRSGAVGSFAVDPASHDLKPINKQPSGGSGPCYVSVARDGGHVFAANYTSGSVAALPVDVAGRLAPASSMMQHSGGSVNPKRQAGPHAHCIMPDPTGHFAAAIDLGLDQVILYGFDSASGQLTRREEGVTRVEGGRGPRHIAFHPNGRLAYVANEMGNSVTAFSYDGTRGTLRELQTTSTLPEGFAGENTTAEIRVHPAGKNLYVSNRGHDSIAIFRIAEDGRLTPIGHEPTRGKTPRGFSLDPSGKIMVVANQNSDNLVLFRIDADSGSLQFIETKENIGSPVAVLFMPQ